MVNDTRLCTIEGCENAKLARGWCPKHYARWRSTGDPLKTRKPTGGRKPVDPTRSFWSKVDADGDCWEWKGAMRPNGYGVFATNGKNVGAHRFAWENLIGPIPEGLVIDHLCKNRGCVNVTHLEPVTYSENILRGAGPFLTKIRRAVTECKHGHAFDAENTYLCANGKRACRKCRKDRGQMTKGKGKNDSR